MPAVLDTSPKQVAAIDPPNQMTDRVTGDIYTVQRIDPNNPADIVKFDKIYELYMRCFPLETEQVPKQDFIEYLKKSDRNNCEIWAYVENQNGDIVGATNFNVFAGNKTPGTSGTIHATFTFVEPDHRKRGVFDFLVQQREDIAEEFIRRSEVPPVPGERVLTFIEQNSPLLMTPDAILQDQMDTVARRQIFESRGVQALDMRYIQPPATIDEYGHKADPCTVLDLCVKWPNKGKLNDGYETIDSIPQSVIREHLDHWFQFSFPEGTAMQDRELEPMKVSLNSYQQVRTFPRGRYDRLAEALAEKARQGLGELGWDGNLRGLSEADLGTLARSRWDGQPDTMPPAIVTRKFLQELTSRVPETGSRPLGELFPDLAMDFYGHGVQHIRDRLPTASKVMYLREQQGMETSGALQGYTAYAPNAQAELDRAYDAMTAGSMRDGNVAAMSNNPLGRSIMSKLEVAHQLAEQQYTMLGPSIASTSQKGITERLDQHNQAGEQEPVVQTILRDPRTLH